jgi:pyruvate dehydrogenase E2 component (dihydrolipoamide acetyltransferase)
VGLDGIVGTGPQGSITADDVLRAADAAQQGGQHLRPALDHGRLAPMTKVGKVTARRMALSKQSIPHFYVTVSVDMTAAMGFRSDFNSRLPDPEADGVSITDLITRSCALAMKEFPAINSTVRDESTLIVWDDINLGIATSTDAGLVVPVLEDADSMTLAELSRITRRIVAAAREGRQISVAPARFTISNMGMYGVDNFIAIINPPEAAILSVSSAKPTIVPAQDGTPQIRDLMNLTLSLDHRVGDGVLAANFLNRVKALLEDPAKLG